jgi:hypothetical protein
MSRRETLEPSGAPETRIWSAMEVTLKSMWLSMPAIIPVFWLELELALLELDFALLEDFSLELDFASTLELDFASLELDFASLELDFALLELDAIFTLELDSASLEDDTSILELDEDELELVDCALELDAISSLELLYSGSGRLAMNFAANAFTTSWLNVGYGSPAACFQASPSMPSLL